MPAAQTIVNTDLAHKIAGPHHWKYKPGFYAVNEHFHRVDGPRNRNITTDKIVIHHYVLKSLEAHSHACSCKCWRLRVCFNDLRREELSMCIVYLDISAPAISLFAPLPPPARARALSRRPPLPLLFPASSPHPCAMEGRLSKA